jgi:hypothetical protein
MKRKMPAFGEMVLVKALIPYDYDAPSEFHDCHGKEFICTGIRFQPDLDQSQCVWDIWVSPVLEDLHDEDILEWMYIPKDFNNVYEEDIIKDIQLLLAVIPDWVNNVKEGLDPTFYGTGTYERDSVLKQRIEGIREFIKCLT